MSKQLKVLFITIPAVGHVNAAIGLAQILMDSGHKVVFHISDLWQGKLSKYGIEEVIYSFEEDKHIVEKDAAKQFAIHLKKTGSFGPKTPLEKAVTTAAKDKDFIDRIKQVDTKVEEALPSIKPDVIVVDMGAALPSVEKSGIPWVLVASGNVLSKIDDERTPPARSGLSINSDKEEWKRFRQTVAKAGEHNLNYFNEYLKSRGVSPLTRHPLTRHSPYLNIYGFPEELDYTDVRPMPRKWVRFDNLQRTEVHIFEIPKQLRDRPGKLIYLSLGSMGAINLDLMTRLVAFLTDSPNRFIVSKGPAHEKYELANNMWGQQSVPQMQVLPIVDLVITHGGNNTVCETLFFGKPMIVMPLSGDQYDNAQRVDDKGLGLRIDPFECTKEELLNGIESLLNNQELNDKLKNISKRIQTDNSIAKLPQLLEALVVN